MSARDGYEPGVPCWVDTWRGRPRGDDGLLHRAVRLGGSGGRRVLDVRLRGRDVAGLGAVAGEEVPPNWVTYVWVADADATASKVREAGGSLVREPFDALDGGRIAIAADPAGALFGISAPGEHGGAQLVNEPGAWSMSQLVTSDPARANAFYAAVFGWETDSFGDITMYRVPGYVGGEPTQPVSREVIAVMAPAGEGDDGPARWTVDFWVDDVDATVAKASELGGATVAPAFDTPVGRTAVVADPEGAPFSVSQVVPR